MENLGLFTDSQHGFRNKRSTETQLLQCVNDWTSSLDDKECVDIFYLLNVSKAFDTVSHPKLLSKLSRYGIDGAIYDWINAFLRDRVQAVRVEGALSSYESVTSAVVYRKAVCSVPCYF